jgi:epoxide hydrolase-like predicted phosphatase
LNSGNRHKGNEVAVLLFDLGGVLVEYTGVQGVARLLPAVAVEQEILERLSRCPHTEAFGCGQLSRQEFGERFVRDWGIDLPPERFLAEFRSWSKCLLPGAVDLLATLRPRFRLAALSNSNELHWERISRDLGITKLFEVAISSHQVGLRKPDPRIYRAALDRLGVSPDGVVFFDDVHENVVAAAEVGIRAFQVDGVPGIRERLKREQLL